MSVELRERKWCGVLGIEKMGVECCWMLLTIVNGLIQQGRESLKTQKRVWCYPTAVLPSNHFQSLSPWHLQSDWCFYSLSSLLSFIIKTKFQQEYVKQQAIRLWNHEQHLLHRKFQLILFFFFVCYKSVKKKSVFFRSICWTGRLPQTGIGSSVFTGFLCFPGSCDIRFFGVVRTDIWFGSRLNRQVRF